MTVFARAKNKILYLSLKAKKLHNKHLSNIYSFLGDLYHSILLHVLLLYSNTTQIPPADALHL